MNSYHESLHKFKKQVIQELRNIKLSQLDPNIFHTIIIPNSTYSSWLQDNEFMGLYNLIKDNTLLDIYRCYTLYDFIVRHHWIRGDAIEVGVWKGGSAAIIAKALQKINSEEKVYLFDTFKGVVKANHHDTLYKGGEHSDTSPQSVEGFLKKLDCDNFKLFDGIFPDEINFEKINIKPKIKLCHIDVDTYQSAKDCLLYIWEYIVTGGVVIFDDFGIWGCEGVTKFVNELYLQNSRIFYNLTGQAILIKV